jgi:hypothetical protein
MTSLSASESRSKLLVVRVRLLEGAETDLVGAEEVLQRAHDRAADAAVPGRMVGERRVGER